MEIVFVISLGIIGVTSIIVLSILVYNQMLMVNEINKRLLLLAKESQEKERITMAELEEWIRSSGNIDAVPSAKAPEEEQPFDPFSFQEKEKETDL
jgi:hypothetical protein